MFVYRRVSLALVLFAWFAGSCSDGDSRSHALGPGATADLGSSDLGVQGADSGLDRDLGTPRDAQAPADLAPADLGGPADLAPDLAPDLGPSLPDLHVVVVVIDGARFSETLGSADRSLIPRMAALAEEGCTAGAILNRGTTTTKYGMGMLLTGAVDAFAENPVTGRGYFTHPTVWEYYRKHYSAAPLDAWYVLTQMPADRLWQMSPDPDYGEPYWGQVLSQGYGDDAVTAGALAVLRDYAPHLLVLYLADVDSAGHSGDWATYTAAVQRADANVGRVWDAIEADEALAGRTLLLVSNDHGRHDEEHGGFQGHGCGCSGCRNVMLLAAGPGVDPQCQQDHAWSTVDLVPTIGRVLGFPTERVEGQAMDGIFLPPP